MCKQEGFGFVTFEHEYSAVQASQECALTAVDGIALKCKLCTKAPRVSHNAGMGGMAGGMNMMGGGMNNVGMNSMGNHNARHMAPYGISSGQGYSNGNNYSMNSQGMHSMSLPPPSPYTSHNSTGYRSNQGREMLQSQRNSAMQQHQRQFQIPGDTTVQRNNGNNPYQVIPPQSGMGMNRQSMMNNQGRSQYSNDFALQQQQQQQQLRQAALSFQQQQQRTQQNRMGGNFEEDMHSSSSNRNNMMMASNLPPRGMTSMSSGQTQFSSLETQQGIDDRFNQYNNQRMNGSMQNRGSDNTTMNDRTSNFNLASRFSAGPGDSPSYLNGQNEE